MAADFGIFLAVTAMLSWGFADFLAKKAIDKVGYKTSIVLNQAVSLVPTLIFASFFFKMPSFSAELILIIVVSGLSGIIGYIFLFRGFQRGNLSVVAPITASWSVITVLLATILFGEALTLVQIAGIAATLVGVFLASTNLADLKHSITHRRSAGATEGIIAMVAWGISYALIKTVTSAIGPVMALLFLKIFAVGVLFSWAGATKAKISIPAKYIFMLIAAAGFLDFLAFIAFNVSLGSQFVSVVTPIVAAAPAVTIVLAYFFLKERVSNSQKLGIIAILFGLILISLA